MVLKSRGVGGRPARRRTSGLGRSVTPARGGVGPLGRTPAAQVAAVASAAHHHRVEGFAAVGHGKVAQQQRHRGAGIGPQDGHYLVLEPGGAGVGEERKEEIV